MLTELGLQVGLPWMLTELGLQVGLPWGKVSIAHRKKLDKFLVDGHDHDLKFVTDYYNLAKQGDIDTIFSGLMMGVFYNIPGNSLNFYWLILPSITFYHLLWP